MPFRSGLPSSVLGTADGFSVLRIEQPASARMVAIEPTATMDGITPLTAVWSPRPREWRVRLTCPRRTHGPTRAGIQSGFYLAEDCALLSPARAADSRFGIE